LNVILGLEKLDPEEYQSYQAVLCRKEQEIKANQVF